MYAVIFRASVTELDDEYADVAQRLKRLAFDKYGCRDFVSVTGGNEEIAISYWDTRQQILDWKNAPEHKAAQAMGREKWYRSWRIEICELISERQHAEGPV